MTTNNAANFGTGTAGQVLTSNGVGVAPTFQSLGSGNWVKLQTQTPSSVASIAFNSTYITNTYKTYVIVVDGASVSSGSTLNMTVSTDNGSTYLSTGYVSALSYFTYNSATIGNQNGTSAFEIFTGANADIISGTLWLYNLATANGPSILGDFWIANNYWEKCFGYNTTTSTVNNIKFAISGDFSGTFTLYGLVQ